MLLGLRNVSEAAQAPCAFSSMAELIQKDHVGGDNEAQRSDRSPFSTFDSKPGYRIHKRRPRKPVSCVPCRRSKLKCDRQQPCASCKRRECVESCTYRRARPITPNDPSPDAGSAPSPVSISSPIQQNPQIQDPLAPVDPDLGRILCNSIQAASATPQAHDRLNDTHGQWDALLQRPMDQMCQSAPSPNDPFSSPGNLCFPFPFGPTVSRPEILAILPPAHCCDYLVAEYFTHLSPLFHILHGPTFQKQYNTFRQNPSHADLSWIALLFAICSATMNTMEQDDAMLIELRPDTSRSHDISDIAYRFRTAAMICLSQDKFMIRHSLSTLEALLLLIYTISNHEGAERSWTLLGNLSDMAKHSKTILI